MAGLSCDVPGTSRVAGPACAGLRRAPGLVPPRTGWASPGRAGQSRDVPGTSRVPGPACAGLRRAPGLVPPRTGCASPGRARSAVAWPECGRRCRRAPGGQGVARAEAAGARRVPGVRRAARARCPCRMPVPGFCGRGCWAGTPRES